MVETHQITVVWQGPLQADLPAAAARMRALLPGARLVLTSVDRPPADLSPWQAAFDEVVFAADPGPLPALKFRPADKLNNVNRQLAGLQAGLARAATPYCLRLRTDARLTDTRLLDLWHAAAALPGEPRLIASSIFTINPRYDERMAYHIGDMFLFGRTPDVQEYFAAPPMPRDTATWYESHPHAPDSRPREREFRARYAVEQWICLHYLFGAGPYPVAFHNDISPAILAAFEDRLVDRFVIVHPRDIGLAMAKFTGIYRRPYFNALCYSLRDWQRLLWEKRGLVLDFATEAAWPASPASKAWLFRLHGLPMVAFGLRLVRGLQNLGRRIRGRR